MDILNTLSLKSNRQIKINFDGGDLSSDAGLLLIQEFAAKIGFLKLIKKKFKTNDKSVRFHKDDENLMQMVYQIISAYFEDDCADELTLDPVFNLIILTGISVVLFIIGWIKLKYDVLQIKQAIALEKEDIYE